MSSPLKSQKSQDIQMLENEKKRLGLLRDVSNTDGGKAVVDHTRQAIRACVHQLSVSYMEKSEQEIRSLCATLRANMELFELLAGAQNSLDAIEKALLEVNPT